MEGAVSSLDPYGQSLGESPCPRRTQTFVCEDCGLVVQSGCGAAFCEVCGPKQARRKARLAAWAKPVRFATFTNAPDDWQGCRCQMFDVVRRVRLAGFEWEMAWTSELTKSGRRHVHALQWGDYVPQAKLQELWGNRIVDIRAIRGAKRAAGYALKEASRVAGYATKGSHDLSEHLALNGGRLIHWTRGYLRGMTQREAYRAMTAEEGHKWRLVAAG